MKVGKKDRNAHIRWTLAKYAGTPKDLAEQAASLREKAVAKMAEVEAHCTSGDCPPEEWVKLVPSMDRIEAACEAACQRLTDSDSIIGKLDALRGCLPA